MQIKPVIKTVKPKYPDKYEIDLNRALLNYRPMRWMKEPIVGIMLTAIMTTVLSSCSTPPSVSPESNKNLLSKVEEIPFFKHGEGTGYYGGYGGSDIQFISEKDAYNLISSELKKAGFTCKKGGDKIKDSTIPATYPYGSEPHGDEKFEKKSVISRELDFDARLLLSNDYKINIEFISEEDYMNWSDPDAEWISSVTEFDLKETAKELKAIYKNAAVFYDPLDGREKLRLQVLDFIEWLKSIDAVQ